MITHTQDTRPFERLKDLLLRLSKQNDVIVKMLDRAFDVGGYVAGGCANFILRNMDKGDIHELYERRYSTNADIDVFFPDNDAYEKFTREVRHITNTRGTITTSVSKAAFCDDYFVTNHEFYQHPRVYVQAVKAFVNDVNTQLESFDIANCKVAFDRDTFAYDVRVPELERSNTLVLDVVLSPYSVSRVAKYVTKNGYKHISRESEKMIVEFASTYMRDDVKAWKSSIGRIYDKDLCVEDISRLLKTVSDDTVLALAMFGGNKRLLQRGYDAFKDELVKRIKLRANVNVT
jgi:hypothetical protein